jgi:hypothetical protein
MHTGEESILDAEYGLNHIHPVKERAACIAQRAGKYWGGIKGFRVGQERGSWLTRALGGKRDFKAIIRDQ